MTEATRVTGAGIEISMMLRQSYGFWMLKRGVAKVHTRPRTPRNVLVSQVEWIVISRHVVATFLEYILEL